MLVTTPIVHGVLIPHDDDNLVVELEELRLWSAKDSGDVAD